MSAEHSSPLSQPLPEIEAIKRQLIGIDNVHKVFNPDGQKTSKAALSEQHISNFQRSQLFWRINEMSEWILKQNEQLVTNLVEKEDLWEGRIPLEEANQQFHIENNNFSLTSIISLLPYDNPTSSLALITDDTKHQAKFSFYIDNQELFKFKLEFVNPETKETQYLYTIGEDEPCIVSEMTPVEHTIINYYFDTCLIEEL